MIKGFPLVSTHSLLNQIRLQIPLSPFHLLLAGKLKDLCSLHTHSHTHLQSPTELWAQELLITMQKPRHQNKLSLPEHQISLCGLLLPYLTQQQTLNCRLNSNTFHLAENAFYFSLMSVFLCFLWSISACSLLEVACKPIVFPKQIFAN